MLRLAVPLVMAALGIGAGVGAARILAPPPEVAEDTVAPAEDSGPAEPPEIAGDPAYVRLNNQFVVPVVRDGRVRSVVVMALSIEVAGAGNAQVFSREPRLRDAFLQVMFAHANAGGFDGRFTSAAALAPLRAGLREAARGVLGDAVRDVLIIDIARQDA